MDSTVFRSLLTSLLLYADKPFTCFSDKYKPLRLIRGFVVSAVLIFLRLLPSVFPIKSFISEFQSRKAGNSRHAVVGGGGREAAIARALTQLSSIVTDIPVSSRKYEVVRSLAEKFIDENNSYKDDVLRGVNRTVLTSAFRRTLKQLESAVIERSRQVDQEEVGTPDMDGGVAEDHYGGFRRGIRAARFYWNLVCRRRSSKDSLSRSEVSAEKLAAELLWLAQKMTACGCAEEALRNWSSAQHLAWLSVSAEPRLQGALIRVSAFLLEQARETWKKAVEETMRHELRRTNLNVLVSWLPLLCRGSNGTDTPVLSIDKRAEVEKTLEELINTLEEQEQEKVLSLWLHHFTRCSSSDWPNLHHSYTHWFTASRTSLLCSLN
ncbi:unnamed protein product [Cuscuta epithymum]|uniref:Uncharacterized protein n=1 Tax=Cuscuta epithymum TaxID=186058 RepID=A0AAV0CYS4_9ASTE|nr:unnamed protein product [Cuscuta epithymum]